MGDIPAENKPNDLPFEFTLVAWGILLGFGYLTGWKAYKQTCTIPRDKRYKSRYFWWVWVGYFSIMLFGLLGWLFVHGHIKIHPALLLSFVLLWAIQAQALLQITINRITLIVPDKRFPNRLRVGCLVIVFIIAVVSSCVWVPGRLYHSPLTRVSSIVVQVEGAILLTIDIYLNSYFIRTVKQQLIDPGLDKYKSLVAHNFRIVWLAILLDVLTIGIMFYPTSPFIWLQCGPLNWIAKINIELSTSDLLMKLAFQRPDLTGDTGNRSTINSRRVSNISIVESSAPIAPPTEVHSRGGFNEGIWVVTKTQEVTLDVEYSGESSGTSVALGPIMSCNSGQSPREEREWERVGYHGSISYKAEVSVGQ